MKRTKYYFVGVILILLSFIISSCDKKEEQQNVAGQKEQFSNKEKELKDKEDFLKIKEEQLKQWEDRLKKMDSTLVSNGKLEEHPTTKDSVKITAKDTVKVKPKEKKHEDKEKELNKRFGDPKIAIGDYLEYLQRGISDSKTFDTNMKKASDSWDGRTADSFKKNYKNVKKFTITEPPSVVSQKGSNAVVKVKVKQATVGSDGKEVEKESTISYNLTADKNGKWKIKSNVVK